ncbi:hypothetical protein NS277_14065 [Novosphingobium barchaimii]|nr:hypothetical protein NS277_14065 [Novosphingobium barchaimii]
MWPRRVYKRRLMLRRLLALLLLFALSAPALAMSGHCAPPPTHHIVHAPAHEKGHHSDSGQPERRDCIGCVLPDFGMVAAPKAQLPAALIGLTALHRVFLPPRARPEVPPPRS